MKHQKAFVETNIILFGGGGGGGEGRSKVTWQHGRDFNY